MIYMEQAINDSFHFNKIIQKYLQDFCEENSADFSNFKDEIKKVEIKYRNTKIPKFTLQVNGFVYSCLVDLPVSNFTFETTRKKNFENIFKIVNVKLYFHHSHVTGKVYGCAYDLFNWKVRGIQMGFFCIAYNLSGFDFFFLSK